MRYFVGAYWGMRQETREACAERIALFLQALAKHDEGLSRWFKQMASRKSPVRPIPNDKERLLSLLKTSNRDDNKEPIPDLGFNFSAWTGFDASLTASVLIFCGKWTKTSSNSVVLSFNKDTPPSLMLLSEILKSSVSAFDPDDAVVTSSERLAAHAPSSVTEAPAFFRYKRGLGYSENN